MKKLSAFLLLLALAASCSKKQNPNDLSNIDCSSINAKYAADIKPIMSASCIYSGCHEAGSSRGDFTAYAGLKAVADKGSLESKVIKDQSMPPSGPCSLDNRKQIQCWINAGAPNN